MSRMFPLLGSLLGSTPGRRRGGGAQGSFDFTTMNSAQLQEAGWSWTRGNAIWVPDSAGDYTEIAAGVLAKSDLGVHCFGGFENLAPGSALGGSTIPAVKLATGWGCTYVVSASSPVNGLGALRVRGEDLTFSESVLSLTAEIPNVVNGTEISSSVLVIPHHIADGAGFGLHETAMWTSRRDGDVIAGTGNLRNSVTATLLHKSVITIGEVKKATLGARVLNSVAAIGVSYMYAYLPSYDSEDYWDVTYAGPQVVLLPISPNVLALSSAATTETAAQIPVLSRVTPGECSFVLPVITSPGRKGTDDVIASASLDANNQLLVVHENADNNILLRLVTAGSMVGEVDLGIVGDNVYTVISGSVEIGRLAGALEGMSEMIEVTGSGVIPPPAFTYWTLGNDHSQAAATQFWGSVAGLRIN